MRRSWSRWSRLFVGGMLLVTGVLFQEQQSVLAQEPAALVTARTITGAVQNQDLRRVDQAIVQVRDQEGNVVAQGVTNQAGEFSVTAPREGTYSVSAVQDTYQERVCGG